MRTTPASGNAGTARSGARVVLWSLRAVLAGGGALVALALVETVLQWRQAWIGGSDALSPGMIRYHPRLGWELTPGWRGGHRHHDFATSYTIGADGFRSSGRESRDAPLTVMLGDSFTFGIGVADEQTFVRRMADQDPARRYLNGGVPGYSTDQQLILLEERIGSLRPERVVLVVYVGNDLLDNLHPWPVQAQNGKPLFRVLPTGTLELSNVPVPLARKPGNWVPAGLFEAVLGDRGEWHWRTRLAERWQVFGLLDAAVLPAPNYRRDLEPRLMEPIAFFARLLERFTVACESNGTALIVVTLAGASHAAEPDSVAGQYQTILIQGVQNVADEAGLPYLPVAELLQQRVRAEGRDLYFRHEGHLNAAGHGVVGELLAELLAIPGAGMVGR